MPTAQPQKRHSNRICGGIPARNHKSGRNKVKCQRYRDQNRRARNKARRIEKEARRQARFAARRMTPRLLNAA
jgi:hypothetical protein